ncbi:MAG TPA: DUF6510 family protein [Actinomycetota bacterium]|nr:DUF6510 family protein [Actinomycetota bacterium]
MGETRMRVDGNAMGGTLSEVFAREMTPARMTCDGCGQMEPVGAEYAYLQAPGMVLRCSHCEQVLLVVTRANGTYLLSFRGVRWLELPAES